MFGLFKSLKEQRGSGKVGKWQNIMSIHTWFQTYSTNVRLLGSFYRCEKSWLLYNVHCASLQWLFLPSFRSLSLFAWSRFFRMPSAKNAKLNTTKSYCLFSWRSNAFPSSSSWPSASKSTFWVLHTSFRIIIIIIIFPSNFNAYHRFYLSE